MPERDSGPRPEAKRRKRQDKCGKCDTRVCWSCGKIGHIAAKCTKESWNSSLNAEDEDKRDITEEVHECEDEMRAWCLLEGNKNEQWQEVTKEVKIGAQETCQESLLSVEHNSCASPRTAIEVTDNWVKPEPQWTQERQGMSCRQRCFRE